MNKSFLLNVCSASLVCFSLFLTNSIGNIYYGYIYYIASSTILVSVILYVLFNSYKSAINLPTNSYLIFFSGFLLWATLSIFWSPVFSDSLKALTLFYLFPIGVILGYWSNEKQQEYFQSLLIFLLLVIFWKSCQQKFILFPSRLAYGFFANKNTNSIFVCMILLPICSQFINKDALKKNTVLYGSILFIGAFIVSLTISRGAVLGLAVGLLLLFFHTRLQFRPFISFIKVMAYLSAGYLTGELINGAQSSHRLTRALSSNISSVSNGRDHLWQSGWEMYLDRPFFGWGLNMFHWLFPQYRHAPDFGMYAHNDYLQFLLELGPIGLFAFLGFLLSFFIASKKLYVLSANQGNKVYVLGLIAACVTVFVHSFFTFNLYQPAPLLILGLYIGVITQKLNAATSKNNLVLLPNANKYTSSSGYYGILVTFSLILAFTAFTHTLSLKKLYTHKKNSLIHLEEAESAYRYKSYDESILAAQLNIYSDLLQNKDNDLTLEGKNFLIKRGIKVSEEAIAKNPYRSSNYINRALLFTLASNDDYPNRVDELRQAYNKAIQINPFDKITRVKYASELLIHGKKQEAIQVFEGGLGRRYNENYDLGIRYLQLLYATISDSGNEGAINSVKQQIDALLNKKGRMGNYTLKKY